MLNRGRSTSAIFVVVASFLLVACDGAPVQPEGELLNELSRDGGTVTVPMEVDATFMWIVDTEDVPVECEGTPGLAEGFGSGEATHLGRFEVTKLDHCSVDIAAFLADIAGLEPGDPGFFDVFVEHLRRNGEFVFTAADGSTISGDYVIFLFAAGPGSTEFGEGASFTMTVTDGTGRFEGATGELEADLERSIFPFSDDPLFLEKTTFPVVFEGELTIPRP